MRRSGPVLSALALALSSAAWIWPTPRFTPTDITGGSPAEPVFQVFVISLGVGRDATRNLNEKAGVEIWKGARKAWERGAGLADGGGSPAKARGRLFALEPLDDRNDPDQAAQKALDLSRNPRVLAVIGHGGSGATRRAAEIYAAGRIPLVMPAATSQSVTYPMGLTGRQLEDPSRRLDNCYRLLPSDDKAQAPAMAHLIQQLAGGPGAASALRVFLIRGRKGGAAEYAAGLGMSLHGLLVKAGIPIEDDADYTAKPNDDYDIQPKTREIANRAGPDDVVVFCGYDKEADDLLAQLDVAFKRKPDPQARPTVVVPEACHTADTSPHGFRLYRMSPTDVSRCPSISELAEPGGETVPFERVYGYDAVAVINRALRPCETRGISRACLLEELQTTPAFPSGACFGYAFNGGENVVSSYFVFPSKEAPFLTRQANDRLVPAAARGSSIEVFPFEMIRMRAMLDQ